MSYSYGEWKDKEGRTATLQSDSISRLRYERKGWEYVGPAKQIPGLEPANQDGEREGVKDLSGEEVVKQAADVVLRKMSGTWTEAEARAERAEIRDVMNEHGSFDWYRANLPEEERKSVEATPPIPYPLEGPPAGAAVSLTGGDGVPLAGPGASGAPTDGDGHSRRSSSTASSSTTRASSGSTSEKAPEKT